nr:ABC transporter substrate-binding protein [Kineosporia babensis]
MALGATLVAVPNNAVFENGLAPWQQEAASVERFDTTDGLPYEKLAAYTPDVILASDDYTLPQDYPTLTKIAPTLGYQTGPGADSWQDMTTRAGQVLGLGDQATEAITRTEKAIEDAKAASPGLEGKTFVFGPVQGLDSIHSISNEKDASAQFFSQFGMTLSPGITALPDSETPGRAIISPERMELLEADVLILTYADDAAKSQLEEQKLFQNLDVVKRGSYVALTMNDAIALGFPSVLSIPYGLENVLPRIVEAAGKSE